VESSSTTTIIAGRNGGILAASGLEAAMTTADEEFIPIAIMATHHEITRLSMFTEELVKGCLAMDESGARHKLTAVLRVFSELGIIWRILSEIDVRGVMTKTQRQFLQDFYAGITY